MQAILEDTNHQTLDASRSNLASTYEQSQKIMHDDQEKDCITSELPAKFNDEVSTEYLSELPPHLQAKMSVGKKLYSGCVRMQQKMVTVYLLDADLWHRFRGVGTEMIITKKGRRVFPVPTYALSGLDPEKLYDVTLEINSVDHTVHKFSNGEWIPSKEGSHLYPTPVPGRSSYVHPFSPNTGLHWMREPITFSGLKISNNLDAMGTIVLQSMRKYTMSLIISELNGSMKVKIPQPETLFVAVTQYQNEKITQMKIEHNPFANGFRFTASKSKDKHKRRVSQDADSEDENKTDEVTSKNSSLLGSPVSCGLSDRDNSEIMACNTNKLAAYLNGKREVFKHILPVYIDHPKVGASKQNQCTDPKIASWPSAFMPSHDATFSLYNSSGDFSGKSHKRGFMVGEANPLAQVRKFGELNRCSNMDKPLSLVKKKKREDHVRPEECCNESSRTLCTSLPDFGHSARRNLRFTSKDHTSKGPLCHLQTTFADGQNEEHANVNEVNPKVEKEKTGSSPQSRFSCRSNKPLLSKKSEVCEDPSCHLHTGITNVKSKQILQDNICCLPATSSVPPWRPTDSDEVCLKDQDTAKDLRVPENYSSVKLETEQWLLTSIKPEVTLKNGDLWATTHEVVVSSEGRSMFPSISLLVSKLDPDRLYHISLKLIPNTPWFYDYSDHEWTQSVEATGEYKRTIYPHPDSPKSGCQWGTDIVFDKLRLSTLKQGKNTVKLQLRRQYLPVVTIDTENKVWEYPLKDATFITVKIDRSPYVISGFNVCYPASTPEFDRIINDSLTRTAHRKQTHPKRRTTDRILQGPEHVWTLSNLPTQSSPLDLKTTSSSSRVSPAVTHQLSPATQTFSVSSSVVSTTSAQETVMTTKYDINLN